MIQEWLDRAEAQFFSTTPGDIAASRALIPPMLRALRAVLDRHRPIRLPGFTAPHCFCCRGSDLMPVLYPCPTVSDVTAALPHLVGEPVISDSIEASDQP